MLLIVPLQVIGKYFKHGKKYLQISPLKKILYDRTHNFFKRWKN